MTLFSVRTDYALRALTEIAQWQAAGRDEPLPIEEIARRQAIPRKFLEQILVTLKRAGFVRSRRGQAGGYLMEQNPEAIRLADVLTAMESLPANPGENGRDAPPTAAARAVRESFDEIARTLREALEERTLADLMARSQSRVQRPMYHI